MSHHDWQSMGAKRAYCPKLYIEPVLPEQRDADERALSY
jgi:hypothetical protein